MLKVGVTGGIGSENQLYPVFSALGVPVYDSDQRAKSLMQYDDSIRSKIKMSLEIMYIIKMNLIVHIWQRLYLKMNRN